MDTPATCAATGQWRQATALVAQSRLPHCWPNRCDRVLLGAHGPPSRRGRGDPQTRSRDPRGRARSGVRQHGREIY